MNGHTVFLAGTNEFKHLAYHIGQMLEAGRFDIIWFHGQFDISLHANAMDVCKENARKCDLLVLLVGSIAGFTYPGTGRTISEEEFLAARDAGRCVLVLVEANTWLESKQYHRTKRDSPEQSPNQIVERLELKADPKVLDMLEQLQHLEVEDRPTIPWIASFQNADDAFKEITNKWARFRAVQAGLGTTLTLPLFPDADVAKLSAPRPTLTSPSYIRDIQLYMRALYPDVAASHGLESLGTCLAESGGLLTSEKRRTFERFPEIFAGYIESVVRFCNFLDMDIEEEAFNKFPGVCAYCRKPVCQQTFIKPARKDGKFDRTKLVEIAQTARERGEVRFSLDSWATHICAIYPRNWDKPVSVLVERIHEEQSELLKAARSYHRRRSVKKGNAIAEEIADLISWLTVYGAVVLDLIKSFSPPSTPISTLQDCIVHEYSSGCPRCGKALCQMKGDCAV